jgi:hypothetical protein
VAVSGGTDDAGQRLDAQVIVVVGVDELANHQQPAHAGIGARSRGRCIAELVPVGDDATTADRRATEVTR